MRTLKKYRKKVTIDAQVDFYKKWQKNFGAA
jgi:hypothetical protein